MTTGMASRMPQGRVSRIATPTAAPRLPNATSRITPRPGPIDKVDDRIGHQPLEGEQVP